MAFVATRGLPLLANVNGMFELQALQIGFVDRHAIALLDDEMARVAIVCEHFAVRGLMLAVVATVTSGAEIMADVIGI